MMPISSPGGDGRRVVVADPVGACFGVRRAREMALLQRGCELAHAAEVALVIGRRDDPDARRLRDACARAGTPAFLLCDLADLRESWIAGRSVVGVAASPGTPEALVRQLVGRLLAGVPPRASAAAWPAPRA